jgi:hypothetical protein
MISSKFSPGDVSHGSDMNTTIRPNLQTTERGSPYTLPVIVLTGLIVLGGLAASFGPKRRDLPAELMGVWKTDQAQHSSRFLELSVVSVSFGTGSGTVSTGFIRSVAIAPHGTQMLYTVTYRDDDGDQQLSFLYQPSDATLRLKNQDKVVWRKSDGQ